MPCDLGGVAYHPVLSFFICKRENSNRNGNTYLGRVGQREGGNSGEQYLAPAPGPEQIFSKWLVSL